MPEEVTQPNETGARIVRTYSVDVASAEHAKRETKQMVFKAPAVTVAPQSASLTEAEAELEASSIAASISSPEVAVPSLARGVPAQSEAVTHQDSPSPVHTYSSDFAKHAKDKSATSFSVLASELDAGTKQESHEKKSASVPTFIGVLLILVGLASVAYTFYTTTQSVVVPLLTTVPSRVYASDEREVKGTTLSIKETLDAYRTTPFNGSVVLLYAPTSSASSTEKTGLSLIEALALPLPDILLRNVSVYTSVVLVKDNDLFFPAFVFDTTSYERTFAGMLDWEDTMATDLSFAYPVTETASTSGEMLYATPREVFVDEVVENQDVRVLYDDQNNSILVWGYKDRQTLIVARNKSSFATLVSQLKARQ